MIANQMEPSVTDPRQLADSGDLLVADSWVKRIEEHPAWPSLSRVPERLTALLPLRGFRVAALLSLEKGQIIESNMSLTADIPMKISTIQIAWGEFEVVEHTMAVRLTRMA